MALTGLCTDVTAITLREFWECGAGNPQSLSFVGFGKTVAEAQQMPIGELASKNFLKAIVHTAEKVLGVKYDRIEEEYEYIPTPKDIQSAIFVPAGTVACLSNRMKGYVDAKGSQPFFTMEYNWLIDYSMLPEGIQPDQYWVATIEGRPSLKMTIDLKASIEHNTRFFNIGDRQTEPGYHGTIAPCLQAIPHICKAAPGVVQTFGPGLHWMQDLRDSVAH
jgi:4-hydroxy-tetrahydrodipicolinate reductase